MDGNLALFVNDATVSMAADAQFGWGASYLPTPLTERERVPGTADILEVHRLARAMELLLEAEIDCKSTGFPSETVCSRALLRITQAAPGKNR